MEIATFEEGYKRIKGIDISSRAAIFRPVANFVPSTIAEENDGLFVAYHTRYSIIIKPYKLVVLNHPYG